MRLLITTFLLAGISLLQDAPKAQNPFIGKLEARLQKLNTATQEHQALKQVRVRIVDLHKELGANFSPTIGGIRSEDGILLSSTFLDGLYSEIKEKAPEADKDAVMEIAASQFVPLFAHELRHAVDGDEVGISSFGYQESELSARTVETLVLVEAINRFPEDFQYETSLTKAQSELLGHWKSSGPDGLRAYDRETVAGSFPSLERGDDLLGLSERAGQAKKLRSLISRGPPGDDWIARTTGGSLETRRDADRFILQGEEIGSMLKRLDEVRWYYVERERDAWQAWRSNRSL